MVRSLARNAREVARNARDVAHIVRGAIQYARTGETPPEAYQSLISLYCATRGLSNDALHAIVRARRRPFRFPSSSGVLGNLGASDIRSVAERLDRDGYYVFPARLPDDVCDRLTQLALRAQASPRPHRSGLPPSAVYDPARPIAEAYHFSMQTLMGNADVQRLIADYSILGIAQAYLRSQPVLDIVAMWWSTAAKYDGSAAAELAQLYHFDMDRIKWLKFFFYLTDVTPENGPHVFVARSHVRGSQPRALLQRGYARIQDDEVAAHYRRDAFIEMTGPRGTIIAEDTRGLHKGKVPTSGHRLVLQFEFANSLFGGALPKPRPVLEATSDARLVELARDYPHIFSLFNTREIAGRAPFAWSAARSVES